MNEILMQAQMSSGQVQISYVRFYEVFYFSNF